MARIPTVAALEVIQFLTFSVHWLRKYGKFASLKLRLQWQASPF
jgi:hypothetical protein